MALMKREDGSFIPPETGAKSREDNSWLDMPWGSQLIARPRLAAGRERVSLYIPERESCAITPPPALLHR